MAITLSLKSLVDDVQMQNDELVAYLKLDSGEVVTMQTSYLADAEDGVSPDEYDNWEKENMEEAVDIVENSDNYLALPSKYDINEYQIMVDFKNTLNDSNLIELFNVALYGVGAFRRFKDLVYRYDLSDEWFKFRDQAYREVLIDWCIEHNFDYIDDFEHVEN